MNDYKSTIPFLVLVGTFVLFSALVLAQNGVPRTMDYLVVCKDFPDATTARSAALETHLRHVETVMDKIRVAGPVMNADRSSTVGSLYLYKSTTLEDAKRLHSEDPFFKAGIWENCKWENFVAAAGTYVGGALWELR